MRPPDAGIRFGPGTGGGRETILKFLFRLVLGAVLLGVSAALLVAVLALDRRPALEAAAPPAPEDVLAARSFAREVKAAVAGEDAGAPVVVTEDRFNSMIRLGARFLPGFRGRVTLEDGLARGEASAPVPFTGEALWINAAVTAPEFEGAFALDSIRVGRLDLPPGLALEAGRRAANLIFGNGVGDTVAGAATRLEIEGRAATITLAIREVGGNRVARGVFGALRGSALPPPGAVRREMMRIAAAMEGGALPAEGSFLPLIRFAIASALESAEAEGAENAYTASVLALAAICGARDFTTVVGGLVDHREEAGVGEADCTRLTLNGRVDSRRHFITAAAVQAASNRGYSVTLGEFKELHDVVAAGGFDFSDIAANNSGIRMSNRLMAAPAAEWPALIARIDAEEDVVISFEGLPPIMSIDAFEAAFGTVESPAYAALNAEIEARIDRLALHRAE